MSSSDRTAGPNLLGAALVATALFVAALALTDHDAEAREALQRYVALPSTGPFKTIAAFKAYYSAQGGDPPRVEANERIYEGLRKAGMPEGDKKSN